MRMNQEISKEDFTKQRDKIEDILLNLQNQIIELKEINKQSIDKKERLIYIKDYLGDKLKSPEGIDDEIIKQFLKQVTIKENGEISIILDGDFSFTFKKDVLADA